MKRIHRIGNSKEPTITIMMKMAQNLKAKYSKYATIQAEAWASWSHEDYTSYWVSVDHIEGVTFKTWPEALAHYRKLMKGAKDGSA